jgi:hypothetical protein
MKGILSIFTVTLISAFNLNAQTDYDTLTTTECGEYNWRGNTYSTSGVYYDTVVVAVFDTTYAFTNGDQIFIVPNSLTSISVELWGAGGGVGYDDYNFADGGSGAFVTGKITTTPGSTLGVVVGEGGATGIYQTNNATYGGGTAGTYINNGNYGGAGGGRTAIQMSATDVVSAGGGGGGSSSAGYIMIAGGDGGTGPGPNGGGTGGGYPYDSFSGDGAGGFSYTTDPLFTIDLNTNGGANNAGTGSTTDVNGGHGQAIISWVKDSVYVLDLTINPLDASVTLNGNILISDLIGDTYQWIDCGTNTAVSGATSATFIPTANGDYAVVVTSGSCDDTSACVTYNSVGLNENNSQSVSVYPNPTQGNLTINLGTGFESGIIQITNAIGQVILVQEIDGVQTVDLNLEQTNGIYMVTIFSNGEVVTSARIIKQ